MLHPEISIVRGNRAFKVKSRDFFPLPSAFGCKLRFNRISFVHRP